MTRSEARTPAHLEGEVTFATVRGILNHADSLMEGAALDLSRVTQLDSAGFALLLELTRRARESGGDLELRGASPKIVRLAQFFGLDEVLTFARGEAATAPG